MYSGLTFEDHIIKGILFIYSLLASIHSLQLVCHSNHVAVPAAVFVGPTKFISKSCNGLAMVFQLSCNAPDTVLHLLCTKAFVENVLQIIRSQFIISLYAM